MGKRRKYLKEMLLPRKFKIKFGEEYSSVYYTTILVLLYNNNAKDYYKMISNKTPMYCDKNLVLCIMFEQCSTNVCLLYSIIDE